MEEAVWGTVHVPNVLAAHCCSVSLCWHQFLHLYGTCCFTAAYFCFKNIYNYEGLCQPVLSGILSVKISRFCGNIQQLVRHAGCYFCLFDHWTECNHVFFPWLHLLSLCQFGPLVSLLISLKEEGITRTNTGYFNEGKKENLWIWDAKTWSLNTSWNFAWTFYSPTTSGKSAKHWWTFQAPLPRLKVKL